MRKVCFHLVKLSLRCLVASYLERWLTCIHSKHRRLPFFSHQAGADPGYRERGGGGGSDKYIHNWGEGMGGGVPPPVTARGSGGALIASPQPLFCFCVYLA